MNLETGGAVFGDISLASLGLVLVKATIPLLPDTRQTEEELPGVDGTIDLACSYGPRVINLEVMLQAKDETEYQVRLQQIAGVFQARSGVKPLVLDRMPSKRWMCKYVGNISIEKSAQLGTFTIPLKAFNPFSESVQDSLTPLEFGQGYTFGMGLRMGDVYTVSAIGSKTFNIYHAGTYEAYPIIRFIGEGTDISLVNHTTGESFVLGLTAASTDVIEVNCTPAEQTVLRNGTNAIAYFSGKFPRLVEGENSFTITATDLNMTVAFLFRHTYLY